jgi:ribosomal protein L11 methylase PrmA
MFLAPELTGGKTRDDGRIAVPLRLGDRAVQRILQPERKWETADMAEQTLWAAWSALRPVIMRDSLAAVATEDLTIDHSTAAVDVDAVMKAMYDTRVAFGAGDADTRAMAAEAVRAVTKRWRGYRFTPPAPTSVMPESLRPAVSSIKKDLTLWR